MTAPPSSPVAAAEGVASLEALLRSRTDLRRGVRGGTGTPAHATGFDALDAALPGGGWPVGGVVELLAGACGIGETSLLLPALATLTGQGGWAAFVAPPHEPYAPALANAGIATERLLVVEAPDDAGAAWAAERLLRSGAVAAVAVWLRRTTPARQRRLQLAAETRGAGGSVDRAPGAADAHSPVALRMVLEVRDGAFAIRVIKARGGAPAALAFAPSAFDAAQGAPWPVPAPAAPRAPVTRLAPPGASVRAPVHAGA